MARDCLVGTLRPAQGVVDVLSLVGKSWRRDRRTEQQQAGHNCQDFAERHRLHHRSFIATHHSRAHPAKTSSHSAPHGKVAKHLSFSMFSRALNYCLSAAFNQSLMESIPNDNSKPCTDTTRWSIAPWSDSSRSSASAKSRVTSWTSRFS